VNFKCIIFSIGVESTHPLIIENISRSAYRFYPSLQKYPLGKVDLLLGAAIPCNSPRLVGLGCLFCTKLSIAHPATLNIGQGGGVLFLKPSNPLLQPRRLRAKTALATHQQQRASP